MSVGTTNNVTLVAIGFSSLDEVSSRLGVNHFVHVNFDCLVPSTRDNRMVITTVAYEGDLTICSIVSLKLKQ